MPPVRRRAVSGWWWRWWWSWWWSCGRALGGTDCPQWVLWPLALPPWKAQSSGHSQGLHGSSDLPSPVNITLSDRVNVFLLQGRLFSSPGSILCVDLFQYPFHPRVTAVARKISLSFCQKWRWQVTAKHAYILRMWFNCMKWHGAWLYGLHRTCAETAAVSCGTSHASAVSTPLRWIFERKKKKNKKTRYKNLVTHVEPHASTVSLLKRAENSVI